jgi:hypothetical protein
MGEMRNTDNIVVGKPKWKRSFGKSGRRCVDNTRMELMEIGKVWTGFIWHRIGNRGEPL